MNIFVKAARKKYRFDTKAGMLMVEQLFDLPFTSKRNASLDDTARTIHNHLKMLGEESFVGPTNDPLKAQLQEKLDIVKEVIAIRKAEVEKDKKAKDNAEQIRRIQDALAAIENEELTSGSKEELKARLKSLKGA